MRESCEKRSLLRTIYLTAQVMKSYADSRLKVFDLTVEQMEVIKRASTEIGKTQSRLSEETVKSPANMTRILDRMEKKKLILRRKNPMDRRSSLVFLTEEGENLREAVTSSFHDLDSILLEGIHPESQSVALSVLETINQNVERIVGK